MHAPVSINILVPLGATNGLFITLLDAVLRNIPKWFLILVHVLQAEYACCLAKSNPQVQSVCIIGLVYKLMVEICYWMALLRSQRY
jgi:hypothetical protein